MLSVVFLFSPTRHKQLNIPSSLIIYLTSSECSGDDGHVIHVIAD